MNRTMVWRAVPYIALAIFVVSAGLRTPQTVGQDELHWLGAGFALVDTGVATSVGRPDAVIGFSPHLYAHLIRLSCLMLSRPRRPSLFSTRSRISENS